MEWHVSVFNPATKRSQLRSGEAPDREAAIRSIVDNGRALAQELEGKFGNVVVNEQPGNMVNFGDTSLTDEQMAERVQAAIDYEQQRTAERERKAAEWTEPAAPPPAREPGTTKFSTPAGDVGQQWSRIAQWLNSHQTNQPAAGAELDAIADAEARSGVTWPTELCELFRHVNGIPVDSWFPLFPSHILFDLEQVIDEREVELEVWSQLSDEAEQGDSNAGDSAGTWLPEFIPFAGLDGNFLFVDSRPGPLHGCVSEFEKVGADDRGPQWISLSAMLADLADALDTSGTFAEVWRPSIVNSQLEWTYEANG
ncbi:SMI1/KNR4 family protein [Rhodococcoides yunnanense]|uniref:SMI1/KNR4 family protein n=1 Tax=Rhodococcoides yunnanense TaxID=278209 RepID=A0ABU4B746_9NOCA|nr:SMI1/KNR4 family protein [Rhodococcus yunnanensis]MDV6260010.1 SMI1/KNR4 family protein [Rhodococcus yunnanensis]